VQERRADHRSADANGCADAIGRRALEPSLQHRRLDGLHPALRLLAGLHPGQHVAVGHRQQVPLAHADGGVALVLGDHERDRFGIVHRGTQGSVDLRGALRRAPGSRFADLEEHAAVEDDRYAVGRWRRRLCLRAHQPDSEQRADDDDRRGEASHRIFRCHVHHQDTKAQRRRSGGPRTCFLQQAFLVSLCLCVFVSLW